MAELKIGTCSWKYDSWRGIIYSDIPEINYLEEYSRHFNTVEIDQWFWSLYPGGKAVLPRVDAVDDYNQSVPLDFKFSVKVPNSVTLTHYYRKNKKAQLISNPYFLSSELFNKFLRNLHPVHNKLGPLMFQFEYLNKQKMTSQFDFQIQLGKFFEGINPEFQLALEIRNPNYLNKTYFEFINENNLSHVFLEGYYMPSITDVYEKYSKYIKNMAVVRLHGPDRKAIEEKSGGDWNKIIEPKDNAIHQIIEMIKDLLSREVDVYLNVNNHYEGSAPLTIKKIKNLLNDN